MGLAKWIFGVLGWTIGGPIGALLGYAAGSALENSGDKKQAIHSGGRDDSTQRNDFMVSLLVLIAAIMKADGRTTQSELQVVRTLLTKHFGAEWTKQALLVLRDLLKKNIPMEAVCQQIRGQMNYSQRLVLLQLLYHVAYADGELAPQEDRLLVKLAGELRIHGPDQRAIAAMFAPKHTLHKDYQILEIPSSATDDEVRKAYRRMSMKHHPDKVAHLGPEVQQAATAKFQMVSAAYGRIKKKRGMA